MRTPLISVILPIYNSEKEYLLQAISSVLNQTYNNLELIIIDDGPNEVGCNSVAQFDDNRIRYYRNDSNAGGLTEALNKGLGLATGEFIARMDADDVCMPTRFEQSIKFLEENPDVDILGAAFKLFGKSNKIYRPPSDNNQIRALLIFQCPFCHPTIVFRSSSIKKYNIKYSSDSKCEDYNLWVDSALNHQIIFANLKDVLLHYRIHEKQITAFMKNELRGDTKIIYAKMFRHFSIAITADEVDVFIAFLSGGRLLLASEIKIINEIVLTIAIKNMAIVYCNQLVLVKVIRQVCRRGTIHQLLMGNINIKSLLKLVFLFGIGRGSN